jgi:hypothetical protein
MNVNRRDFLRLSVLAACGAAVGGGGMYLMTRESDMLEDHYKGTERALAAHYGRDRAAVLAQEIRQQYGALAPEMPYIGGEENMFTEWLTYGVYYLAVHQVLRAEGQTVEQAGKVIYDTFVAMADHPKWLIRLVGYLKYNRAYVGRLREAVTRTQERRYPGDWVASFVEGDGEAFDYGLDVTECGICKFYRSHGVPELAPYMCLSDYVMSEAFDRGLVRYKTLAEGADVCDFRYKEGRATYVNPLRDGWPPRFLS